MKRNTNCCLCELGDKCFHRCVWGKGNPHAKVMVIGEAPGLTEDIMQEPFVGEAGKLLDHVLCKLSVPRHLLYITNVFKCRPPSNKLPGIKRCREIFGKCMKYLDEEVKTVKPKAMLLLGNTPLQMIAGLDQITKHEGMLVGNKLYPKLFTIAGLHPAYILRSPSKEVRLAQAIARACIEGGIKISTKAWNLVTAKKEDVMYEYETRS